MHSSASKRFDSVAPGATTVRDRARRVLGAWVLAAAVLPGGTALAAPVPGTADKSHATGVRAKATRTATNGFLSITLDDVTGTFTLTTGTLHPTPGRTVFYDGPSGYISLRDASSLEMWTNFDPNFGSPAAGLASYALRSMYTAPATAVTSTAGTGFSTTFTLPNWRVTQDVLINGSTLADTNVVHRVSVTNLTGSTRQYGLRYLWDWQIAGQDASFFRPRSPDGNFSNVFQTFGNPSFVRYEEVDSPTSPILSVFGTVGGSSPTPLPTPPEQLRYSAWNASFASAWDFTNSGSGSDSAVVYFWGFNSPLSLGPGASATFQQYVTTQISAVGGAPPTVAASVSPGRLTQSGVATITWTAAGSTSCQVTGGQAGSTFNVTQTPGGGSATTSVSAAGAARNDVFRVTCTGPGGTVVGTAVLAVGVPAPPASTVVVSQSPGLNGQPANGAARSVSLSEGARFVAFESTANNLVAGDTNGSSDVFVRNTQTGAITRASVDGGGTELNFVSGEARISRNGRYVAFTRGTGTVATQESAKAISGGQLCVRDLQGNVLLCVSKSPGNAPGNGDSGRAAISADGTVTTYESTATNLTTTPDGNGNIKDVFAYDSKSNTTQNLTVTNSGQPATAASGAPHVSCNGKHFAMESLASLTGSGTQNGVRNVFGISPFGVGKKLASVGVGNTAANGDSRNPKITDDGRFVYFESSATNLVANDTNGLSDIFVGDLANGSVRRLSVSPAGVQSNGASRNPTVTCDGAFLSFDSDASNLVANDGNGATDSFVLNLGTGSLALTSRTSTGGSTNGPNTNTEISPDGTAVGFDSVAGNLGANAQGTVFAGQNPFAGQNYTGAWYDPNQSGHGLFLDQLADGRLVAWWFTFDPAGAQAWFGGVGQLQGSSAVVNVVRTLGTRFTPNFVSAETTNVPIGTLTFNFTSCNSGRVDFALDSTFGTGFMNLTRLSLPIGVACNPGGTLSDGQTKQLASPVAISGGFAADGSFPIAKATENTQGPIAGMTGAWYDPAQNGQGLFFENLGNGNLLIWWFTFGPTGGQAWFGGVGTITSPTTANIQFLKTQGGRWIPNFNPANVTNPILGPATITIANCSSARVDYQLQSGFGTGFIQLVPLVRPVGTTCSG